MKKSIKTAIFACIFAAAFQITAFAGFTWRVESADSSYVGTTNVTVTNTSGKKETEDAPIVKRGAVVTVTEAATSATYTVKAYDGMGNPIRDFNASLGTVKKGGTLQYTLQYVSLQQRYVLPVEEQFERLVGGQKVRRIPHECLVPVTGERTLVLYGG